MVDRDHDEAHEHDGAVARDEEVVHPGEVVDLGHPLDEDELVRVRVWVRASTRRGRADSGATIG